MPTDVGEQLGDGMGSDVGCVGLIVNPHAAHDVRRLTSLAPTVDLHRRINLMARVLAGLAAAGPVEVLYMLDGYGIVEQAAHVYATSSASTAPAPRLVAVGEVATTAAHTASAARAMRDAGARCVVTVGGDGTHRAVAAGWPDAVFASVPAGTNNAFAPSVDPTVLGLAAALYASDPDGHASFTGRVPRLEVSLGGDGDVEHVALVDVATVRGSWIGSRAMWEASQLVEAVVTRSDPTTTGIAGIAGMTGARCGDAALHLRFGEPGMRVLAPLGPGHLDHASVQSVEQVRAGDAVELRGGVTVAFDGEREVVLSHGRSATVALVPDGPRLIHADALVRAAAEHGRFADAPCSPRARRRSETWEERSNDAD